MHIVNFRLSLINWKLSISRWKMPFVVYLTAITASVLMLMILSAALYLLRQNQIQLNVLLKDQQREIQRQSNLLASKDLTTFSTLQTLSNTGVQAVQMPFDGFAGDDASVAQAIAARYEKAGLNPNSAFDMPEDAMGELGLHNLI